MAARRLIRLRQVQALVPLSKPGIYTNMRRGTFPRPIHLGGKAVAWDEAEILAWVEEQVRRRQAVALQRQGEAETVAA